MQDFDFSSNDDWGESDGVIEYAISSSEGEESDGDIMLQPITDVDLPTTKEKSYPSDDSITVTAHRLTMLGRTRRRRKYCQFTCLTNTFCPFIPEVNLVG